MEALGERGERMEWCVIGEPSSHTALGDVVRIGRRGSLSGMLTVKGIQGHVAYPQLADNPIRRSYRMKREDVCGQDGRRPVEKDP